MTYFAVARLRWGNDVDEVTLFDTFDKAKAYIAEQADIVSANLGKTYPKVEKIDGHWGLTLYSSYYDEDLHKDVREFQIAWNVCPTNEV